MIGIELLTTKHKILESDTDLLLAALAQFKVSVWYQAEPDPIGHLMDYGGLVEGYTPESIKIAGALFNREHFEFRVSLRTSHK
ncbi:hypothetical protein NSU18_28715 [Paenibacillus sp. FSL H8-0048]|uniref:hypothetical protein n=1 Tax=Paenibacillus sp. FSL H8-0048 TaxID=2954508 RepID=UPI0030F887DB